MCIAFLTKFLVQIYEMGKHYSSLGLKKARFEHTEKTNDLWLLKTKIMTNPWVFWFYKSNWPLHNATHHSTRNLSNFILKYLLRTSDSSYNLLTELFHGDFQLTFPYFSLLQSVIQTVFKIFKC